MKIITGQTPNLPWWRALDMSDEEIKAYNYKYLKETEMKDDNLSDAQNNVGKCNCDIGMCTHRANCRNNPLKASQDEMDNAVKTYRMETNVYATKIWNEAIEAVLNLDEDMFCLSEIRKLKK